MRGGEKWSGDIVGRKVSRNLFLTVPVREGSESVRDMRKRERDRH